MNSQILTTNTGYPYIIRILNKGNGKGLRINQNHKKFSTKDKPQSWFLKIRWRSNSRDKGVFHNKSKGLKTSDQKSNLALKQLQDNDQCACLKTATEDGEASAVKRSKRFSRGISLGRSAVITSYQTVSKEPSFNSTVEG